MSKISPHPAIERVRGYTPGEQPVGSDFIKLNTNEFPYPPAPAVVEAIRREAGTNLRRYPSPRCTELRERLASKHQVDAAQIFVGNGSDEVLRLLIQAYGGRGRTVATFEPTYSLYETLVRLVDGEFKAYLLDDLVRFPEALSPGAWEMFLLCYPNPPLGTCLDFDNIKYLSNDQSLLVLDEAYIDFVDELDPEYAGFHGENVVRTRTFSKAFGLAGLRIGYALGHERVISQLSRIADSYNVNRISQAAAIAALQEESYYAARLREIRTNRSWLQSELNSRGFGVFPSQGNFIYATHAASPQLYSALKERKILVRHFSDPALMGGLRISIGTREELEFLLKAIDVLV